MNTVIENIKKELNEAINNNADWRPSYTKLMQTLYAQPVLFFALSKQGYNSQTNQSVPLISTKDFGGIPAVYVFSDIEIAAVWMRAYKHIADDKTHGLIGAVHKEPYDFLSVFQIAKGLGATKIMLDEGGSYIGIYIDDFLSANGMDRKFKMMLTEEEMSRVKENNEKIELRFNPVDALQLIK